MTTRSISGLTALAAVVALAACQPQGGVDGGAVADVPAPAVPTPIPVIEASATSESFADAVIYQPLGGRDVTAAFLTMTAGPDGLKLVGAQSDTSATIEIHTHDMTDGQMRMRRVDDITVAAGQTHALKRGGDHMMVFGLTDADLIAGERLTITLVFEDVDGSTRTVPVEFEVVTHD